MCHVWLCVSVFLQACGVLWFLNILCVVCLLMTFLNLFLYSWCVLIYSHGMYANAFTCSFNFLVSVNVMLSYINKTYTLLCWKWASVPASKEQWVWYSVGLQYWFVFLQSFAWHKYYWRQRVQITIPDEGLWAKQRTVQGAKWWFIVVSDFNSLRHEFHLSDI